MANREELGIIRGARAGDADCQLALGKLYLYGGAGLPLNLPTALYWLDRAARQQRDEAWRLIGGHIPFDVARQAMPEALRWYQLACAAGIAPAARVLAQLTRQQAAPASPPQPQPQSPPRRPSPVARTSRGDNNLIVGHYAALAQLWQRDHDAFVHQARTRLRLQPHDPDPDLPQCRDRAAQGGDRDAQLALGLWCARMDGSGRRLCHGIAAVNFKQAIRWLTLAGEQGLAAAWFALSRIYLKPEFSQRCVAEAQRYLERAAALGHVGAQLECGMYAWRNRRADEHGDVRAAYWLQKAAAQGCAEAEAALARIVATPPEARWTDSLVLCLTRELLESQPLLAARLELAALFGLRRAEALLLDVKRADHGHCLVIDIRASYGRGKRRLVLLRTARERQALDRIVRRFESIDSGPDGWEGNYRQRLYRLKTWLAAGVAHPLLAA
ncbi:hypothetical protein GTP44_02575 [Duganella sp. FT50W]|uniref:Sel1 repeat family protein n=1 Tax=Duganella lactea TaxID=2692173 RepID=A0A6L8MDC4_9BURK|nr:tetratricopeptide repeat protein [Duganella lactea]MYM80847.1 hypothetical protein [Duganella lactea]